MNADPGIVNGARKAFNEYDAFGNEEDLNEKDENPFRYSGKYLYLRSDTYYMQARDYAGRGERMDYYIFVHYEVNGSPSYNLYQKK